MNKENPELQYHTAWSNECIEFWFLLHFAYYTANNHRTEYIAFLNDKFKELGIGKYQKNMQNIFEILMEYGNPKLAIRYAKRIMKDGATGPTSRLWTQKVELFSPYFNRKERCFLCC